MSHNFIKLERGGQFPLRIQDQHLGAVVKHGVLQLKVPHRTFHVAIALLFSCVLKIISGSFCYLFILMHFLGQSSFLYVCKHEWFIDILMSVSHVFSS